MIQNGSWKTRSKCLLGLLVLGIVVFALWGVMHRCPKETKSMKEYRGIYARSAVGSLLKAETPREAIFLFDTRHLDKLPAVVQTSSNVPNEEYQIYTLRIVICGDDLDSDAYTVTCYNFDGSALSSKTHGDRSSDHKLAERFLNWKQGAPQGVIEEFFRELWRRL
jgi:hypothetical protein